MESIQVFCGINSMGVPFSRSNRKHIGYYDIIVQDLKSNYDVSGFNISSLSKNCTWDFMKILDENISILQIRNLQVYGYNKLRNANILFKLVVPKNFQDVMKFSDAEDIGFKTLIEKSDNPIFLYNGGQNDFFTFIQAGPIELLNKRVRDSLPDNLEELVFRSIDNVEKNWLALYSINPNVKILSYGIYNSPLFNKINSIIKIQNYLKRDDMRYDNGFKYMVDLYNRLICERANKYDFVYYVPLDFMVDYCSTMDFHPNTKGNELIAETSLDIINSEILKNKRVGRN